MVIKAHSHYSYLHCRDIQTHYTGWLI